MHKLDRTAAPVPACLSEYKPGPHRWEHLTPGHRDQIRGCLQKMQGRRCAYCEGDLDALGQHIEHFRPKGAFPVLTFEWTNLFWSCTQDDSCGRFKDHGAGAFDPNDLVDPCQESPDKYFRFRSDGAIDIRPGLSEKEQKKARETLRVFNLDQRFGRLRSMRQRALEAFCAMEPDIGLALADFTPEDREAFLAEEIERTAGDPFSTVIRHFLQETT